MPFHFLSVAAPEIWIPMLRSIISHLQNNPKNYVANTVNLSEKMSQLH